MPEPLRIGVLASGRGSNFEALVKAVETGCVPAVVAALVTDLATAGALEIARGHGVEALFVDLFLEAYQSAPDQIVNAPR